MVKCAIILAGGKGERLRPFTNDRPKPMIEVGGKPILAYIIEQFVKAGITEFVFACSYKHEVIKSYIGDGSKFGITAKFSIEDKPLGRGGGIKKAMKQLPGGWQDTVVLNGDNLWKLDLLGMMKKHKEKKAVATIAVVPLKSPYGIVEFNDSDEVTGFREKPELPNWINGGVYIFNKEIKKMLPDKGDHETETFNKLPKEKFIVFRSRDYWRGIDTVKDLTEAENEASKISSLSL